MLATILSSAVASLAAALRFLADGLAAIAYANNVSRSTIPPTLLYTTLLYTKFSSRSTILMSLSQVSAAVWALCIPSMLQASASLAASAIIASLQYLIKALSMEG